MNKDNIVYDEFLEICKSNPLVETLNKGESRKILLYTHFDLDGLGSIILLNQFDNIELEYKICPKDGNCCISEMNSWGDYTDVIFTDISVSDEIAQRITTRSIINKDINLILLDHHQSAEYLNKYKWAYVIPQDLDDDFVSSGTSLFCLYLNEAISTCNIDNISTFAQMVAFYDTFYFKREHGLSIFPNKEPYQLQLLLSSMNKDDFIDIMTQNLKDDIIFRKEDNIVINVMKGVIEKECWKYYYNTKICKISGYVVAFVYCDSYVSQVAEFIYEKFPEVDYVCTANMNSGAISLRTKKDINLSKIIAVPNGGGGHPQACGFTINNLETVFKDHILPSLELKSVIYDTVGNIRKDKSLLDDNGDLQLSRYLK